MKDSEYKNFKDWLESLNTNKEIVSLLESAYEKGYEEGYQKRLQKNYEEWNQK